MSLEALEMALNERDFQRALARARELAGEEIPLRVSLEFLPLCPQRDYNAWALRWLQRYTAEAKNIDAVRTVVGLLCEMRGRPEKIVELRKHAGLNVPAVR